MKFSDAVKIGFDTETTGVDPSNARIVTAALIVRGGGRTIRSFQWLIDPGIEIPEEAAAIHGVTTERARAEGRKPRGALDEIAGNLATALSRQSPVIAFNLSYDWTVLDAELRRNRLPVMSERLAIEPRTLVDPHVIDKAVDKYRRGSRKLQPTCEHYGIELNDWHSADADASAAVLLSEKLFERFPYLGLMRPADLYQSQQEWRREQAQSLQAYFRNERKSGAKYNPDAVVNGEWPIQAMDVEENAA
ncbi:exonuclease domain-containing protein [Streptomyces sp. NPDC051677]|uniref:exonuclease domain-containing protein n=1 Tax=Streptomyces sp. NPDC051677 TaxID=3365669 RepID=UPI0037D7641E